MIPLPETSLMSHDHRGLVPVSSLSYGIPVLGDLQMKPSTSIINYHFLSTSVTDDPCNQPHLSCSPPAHTVDCLPYWPKRGARCS